MVNNTTPDNSPLQKSLNRKQILAACGGFILIVALTWILLLGRRANSIPAAISREMPAVVQESIAPISSESAASRPAPSTDEQRDQEERLQMLKRDAQRGIQSGN